MTDILGNKIITLAHGSGGKDSADLMDEIFGKYFSNEILDKMEDGAVLTVKGSKIVTSTDSFVVSPLEFNGGDIGKLSVCGTTNDVLMMGADPKYLTCGFIIEEGLEFSVLERIVKSTAQAADEAGVMIVAGDTKVINRTSDQAGLFINTTGIGILQGETEVSASNCKDGDAVIVSGNLGDHHACILSARMGIVNNIKSDCAYLGEIPKVLFNDGINVNVMRDITRGGLGTVLNEIAVSSGISIELDENSIPVDDEVKGFCGIMGLDPLYMGNEGKMIITVPNSEAEKAVQLIKETNVGQNAYIVGYAKGGSGVFSKTKIGGTRKIDMLYGEGLPRIC